MHKNCPSLGFLLHSPETTMVSIQNPYLICPIWVYRLPGSLFYTSSKMLKCLFQFLRLLLMCKKKFYFLQRCFYYIFILCRFVMVLKNFQLIFIRSKSWKQSCLLSGNNLKNWVSLANIFWGLIIAKIKLVTRNILFQ